MRVAFTGTVTAGSTFQDSHFVLIDIVGKDYAGTNVATSKNLVNGNNGFPDYAFTWDSKSNNNAVHGLEMQVLKSNNTYWNGINMEDIDYNSGQKGTNDINGNSRTTDGYVRTIDTQSTTNLGKTTFIDFAVSWSYLNANTGLNSAQSWRIQFASISEANDHGNLNGDIAGGASPASSVTIGWTNINSIPEPTALVLLLLSGGGLLLRRNHRRAA